MLIRQGRHFTAFHLSLVKALLPSAFAWGLLLLQLLIHYFFLGSLLRHTKVIDLHLVHQGKLVQCFVLLLPFRLLRHLGGVLEVVISCQLQVFSVQDSYCLFQAAKSTFVVARSAILAYASLSMLNWLQLALLMRYPILAHAS